ncbi:Tom7-domain-containing protein [Sistotremastrum suecicum HHB10207 ss-3]|uniref:Tom7-domain-containing protein n=1 Tax=Sistotremastrum suecicum HHB10207 ss-3 TaxID=1314776 RepID=A0A165XY18_9AGAM|nr:Tom7-domain-containing protein [Sistotremastrum suecicum HHB10207 ss-3]
MPSEETKERIIKAIDLGRTVLHYGWIPFIIYVGYTRSNPQPSLIKCVYIPSNFLHALILEPG